MGRAKRTRPSHTHRCRDLCFLCRWFLSRYFRQLCMSNLYHPQNTVRTFVSNLKYNARNNLSSTEQTTQPHTRPTTHASTQQLPASIPKRFGRNPSTERPPPPCRRARAQRPPPHPPPAFRPTRAEPRPHQGRRRPRSWQSGCAGDRRFLT